MRAHPNTGWPHLNLIISTKTLFPNKVIFWGSEQTWILGEHYSTSTLGITKFFLFLVFALAKVTKIL